MATVEKIKGYEDFKKAIANSNYKPIKVFKDQTPALYDEYVDKLKQERMKQRGIVII